MKKMLYAVLAASLMSTSAMAATIGKVHTVAIDADGVVKVKIIKDDTTTTAALPLVGADKKAMLAIILTAKTSSSYISATVGTPDTLRGWNGITLQ